MAKLQKINTEGVLYIVEIHDLKMSYRLKNFSLTLVCAVHSAQSLTRHCVSQLGVPLPEHSVESFLFKFPKKTKWFE